MDVALPCLFSLPLILVWCLVFFAPFQSPFGMRVAGWTFLPILAAAFLLFFLNRGLLRAESLNRMLLLGAGSLALSWGGAALASFAIHQDFFSTGFMAVAQMTALALLKAEGMTGSSRHQGHRYQFFLFGMVASTVVTIWIMLMGYALVTRQEPRWWESLIYNGYNMVLAAFLYFATLRLAGPAVRSIVSRQDVLAIDGFELSEILGESGCLCAWHLLRECRVSCLDITGPGGLKACTECAEPKISLCTKYRSLYNSMRLVRKCFEAFRIGTVQDAEDRPDAFDRGWVFIPSAPYRLERSGSDP